MEKLEFHLIDVKAGKIEPEVSMTVERDENGNFVSWKAVKHECPKNLKKL